MLGVVPTGVVLGEAFERLAAALARVEDFYDSIGGLLGYQLTCLQLIAEQRPSSDSGSGTSCNSSGSASGPSSPGASTTSASSAADGETEYLVPCGLDLASDHPAMAAAARAATAAGISSLPAMAEIYPLGGAGGPGRSWRARAGEGVIGGTMQEGQASSCPLEASASASAWRFSAAHPLLPCPCNVIRRRPVGPCLRGNGREPAHGGAAVLRAQPAGEPGPRPAGGEWNRWATRRGWAFDHREACSCASSTRAAAHSGPPPRARHESTCTGISLVCR